MGTASPAGIAHRRLWPWLLIALTLVPVLQGWVTGASWPLTRGSWAALVVMLYCAGCVLLWQQHRRRHPVVESPWLIAHASQSGTAAELAEQAHRALAEAGQPATLLPMNRLTAEQLAGTEQLVLVLSTHGQGEPPDNAALFARRIMTQTLQLPRLHFALLALGDRSYPHFCAFGQAVQAWLQRCGAHPRFAPILVDRADPRALAHWQHQLGQWIGQQLEPLDTTLQPWTLAHRRQLNPGSPGAAVAHLRLRPHSGTPLPSWRAGDIAVMQPRHPPEWVRQWLAEAGWPDVSTEWVAQFSRCQLPANPRPAASLTALLATLQPLPRREYSIASLPSCGALELVVRQVTGPDGELGLGSGWLTQHAAPGNTVIELGIRSNPTFHESDPERPLILIGNGTGIASLRAHLLAREQRGARPNWLLFGERTLAHDALFDDQLQHWLDTGLLQRLDRSFSRDPGELRYVQDCLVAAGQELQRWLQQGAALYVCGSAEGMATGVHTALQELLGDAALLELIESDRYRRDVY